LEVLVAGTGGGPIDVLFPAPMLGLGFIPAAGFEPTDGVVVRGVEVPELAPEPNCFVGDFVGDYDAISARATLKGKCGLTLNILVGLASRAAGLGLAAFMLILFPAAGSLTLPVLLAAGATTLLGRLVLFRPPGPLAAAATDVFLGGGAGCSNTVTAEGRTNIPRPISHSKYLSPLTLPSFFPV
jgi:hypothetical protein